MEPGAAANGKRLVAIVVMSIGGGESNGGDAGTMDAREFGLGRSPSVGHDEDGRARL